MFWQRVRTFFEAPQTEPESNLHGNQLDEQIATQNSGVGEEQQDIGDLDLLALQADTEEKLVKAHANMWDFDLEAAEEILQGLTSSPHPLVHLHRAQLLAMKLVIGGSNEVLADAIAKCEIAAAHAKRMAHKARERQGKLGEMPVHLSACFVVECTVTEAEALLLAAVLEMYRKGFVPAARLLQLRWERS